jgi:hypothetical protein
MPMKTFSDAAFARAIGRMSKAELDALWRAMASDDSVDETLPPRERLAAEYHRLKSAERRARFRSLDLSSMGAAWLKLSRDGDPGLDELPRAPRNIVRTKPAPQGATPPREGPIQHGAFP